MVRSVYNPDNLNLALSTFHLLKSSPYHSSIPATSIRTNNPHAVESYGQLLTKVSSEEIQLT